MVGRISPQKAPDIFVKMANIINNEIPGSHFIVVGNGEQEEEMKKYTLLDLRTGMKELLAQEA